MLTSVLLSYTAVATNCRVQATESQPLAESILCLSKNQTPFDRANVMIAACTLADCIGHGIAALAGAQVSKVVHTISMV